jgi:hypothetical protein
MTLRRLPIALVLFAAACNKGGTDSSDTDAGDDTDTLGETDTTDTHDTDTTARARIDCEVAIVGGGAGGTHTAFRLAPELGEGVCLFEKEPQLGGRYRDIPMDANDPDSPVVGVGARRVMEGQTVLFGLADELGITLTTPAGAADLINARGHFAFSKEDLIPYYLLAPDDSGDTETALYDELRFGPKRDHVDDYADFRSYINDAVGSEGYAFLHDMSRFRADFEAPLDARGYLDYLDEEWDVCCTPSYPVGGMTQFTEKMAEHATADGARIFLSDPVARIDRADGGMFTLVTANEVVTAHKVVIAAPPSALQWVEGDVVDDIEAQQAYQDIIGIKVVTITQWWPNDWWANVKDPGGTQVWRAWTDANCLTFIEIPNDDYAAPQHVTRSVYNDSLDCSNFWEGLAAQGTDAVNTEVKRDLEHLFVGNGLTEDVTIPEPIKTHVQVWPAAWHWLRAGAHETNAELYDWAAEPLPGEEVGLVGEAYNVQRSGWSDGAYKSSINLLNTKYGMDLPTE